jgi:8-oxo-dGTP pyrophosphatase MutT (NUDIX family)
MYKVFFNDSFFILTQKPDPELHKNWQVIAITSYTQIEKWLLEIEKTNETIQCIFTNSSPTDIWHDFYKNIRIVAAAGGLVRNDIQKYLFIFRRGKWDLPKGKIDKGESTEEAAIREVKEETGLENVYIDGNTFVTYHVYRYKGKLALKPTYWYPMVSLGNDKLIPQTNEDIEKAEWFKSSELTEIKKNMFGTIHSVIDFYEICEKKLQYD